MYEPVKFKRLKELAHELNEKLTALTDGKLSSTELENMTENSRELYERLVVLRFKAFSEEVKEPAAETNEPAVMEAPVTESPVESPAEETPAVVAEIVAEPVAEEAKPISFKIDVAPNQVSLIDAIEEVVREEVKPEVVAQVSEVTVTQQVTTTTTQVTHTESLNDRFIKGGLKETLVDRLEHNPIPDLKKAITLNQRFQFSRELFKGNNQDYEVAIDKLNSAGRDEAMKHLNSLKSKYSWNNESAIANDFVSLVERRHQY